MLAFNVEELLHSGETLTDDVDSAAANKLCKANMMSDFMDQRMIGLAAVCNLMVAKLDTADTAPLIMMLAKGLLDDDKSSRLGTGYGFLLAHRFLSLHSRVYKLLHFIDAVATAKISISFPFH